MLRNMLVLVVCALAVAFIPAHLSFAEKADESKPADMWAVRCSAEEDDPARECEIFQRLSIKDTGQRVAEFAVGFPQNQGVARGVIILPLGILLTEPLQMTIDEDHTFQFKPRYCTAQGCFAFLNLNEKLMKMLKAGGEATISTKSFNGQDVKVKMSLVGFTKALKKIGA